MMALLLLAATQVAPPLTEAEQDIVVIARRLSGASAIVGRDARGRFTCSLNASTGNATLDNRLCKTAANCVKSVGADQAKVSACIDRRKPQLLADVRQAMAESRR
jgi:hypothetical protein